MSNFYTHPRILFVSPDPAFMPKGEGTATEFMSAERDPGFPVRLALQLYKQGLDVYVMQPDFRNIFENCRRKKNNCSNFTLPVDRVHLAQDRAFFHSKIIDLNSEKDNLKIALAFQREVINQIIPRIQPEIIHCCGWMTGLIPAAGRKLGIPVFLQPKNSIVPAVVYPMSRTAESTPPPSGSSCIINDIP